MMHNLKRKLKICVTHPIVSKQGRIPFLYIFFSQRKITQKLDLVSVADKAGKITDILLILEESLFKIVPYPVRKLKDAQRLNCPMRRTKVLVVSCLVTKILFRHLQCH